MGTVFEKHPTIEQCRELWNEYDTPMHIRKHCMAVAAVAYAIGRELNMHGGKLDLDLIMAAGLTHDLVRLRDRHDLECAKIMSNLGYAQEAAIIQVHMMYSSFSPISFINETDLVCLGDRCVIEHEYVGVEKRYQYIIDKAMRNGHPEAAAKVGELKHDVIRLVGEIEEVTGKTMDEITKDIVIE
ncbi:MAG: HDIG domain-containing protein [Bacillota bacterium]|nr:HDIG domain-containing protein [Bacillota bacterium]